LCSIRPVADDFAAAAVLLEVPASKSTSYQISVPNLRDSP
jgi:hypothetical protein